MPISLDDIDDRLIALLRHDARRSVSDLALTLGLSRATVRARMARLKATGAILGYTVILPADAAGAAIRGIMMIEVEGHAADRVVRALAGFPQIAAIHTTNGRWDLVVELGTATLAELDATLRRIRLVPGVTGSDTSILLATPRSTRAR